MLRRFFGELGSSVYDVVGFCSDTFLRLVQHARRRRAGWFRLVWWKQHRSKFELFHYVPLRLTKMRIWQWFGIVFERNATSCLDLKTCCSINSNDSSFRFFLNDTESVSRNNTNVVRTSKLERDEWKWQQQAWYRTFVIPFRLYLLASIQSLSSVYDGCIL